MTELLGSGASGEVWRATLEAPLGELAVGDEIALKRLHAKSAADPGQRAAFVREARVACDVRAPGIVHGLASGEDDLGPWLALRFVPGLGLADSLAQNGALPEPQVRAIAERLTRALLALHAAGYIHGDLKPENVRLDRDGRAVLLDLGFLLAIEAGDAASRITGSLAYLSPEELRGQRATPASEVFNLGLLLYELATNTHPFARAEQLLHGESLPGILLGTPFELPSLRSPTLSPWLDRLLEEMLDPDPGGRPTMEDLRAITSGAEASGWWREHLHQSQDPLTAGGMLSRSSLPLVGRDRELAILLDAARRLSGKGPESSERVGGALKLQGERGAGKSRLIREFSRRVRTSEFPPLYLQGRCSRFEDARPCSALLSLLSRYVKLPGGVRPGQRERERLDALLPSAERETLLDTLDPTYEGSTSSSVPAALSAWLLALAQSRPLVIYLDDLEYADEGTLEVLTRITRHLDSTGLLLILGSKPNAVARRPKAWQLLEDRLGRLAGYRVLALSPLTEQDVRQLTNGIFSHTAPRLRLADVLWKRSQGNPGLINELIRGLMERGQATPGDDGLQLHVQPQDLPLPASLREETAQAYARLGPHDRLWLARLAISGGRIQTRFLLRAWPTEGASELDATLARLTLGGWLRAEGDRYRFQRPALRAAIYKRLGAKRRMELHGAVARALRPGPGGKLSLTDAFQRAFHLRCAGEYAELLQILRPLLQRLLDRGQPARVHTLGLWGLEALAQLPSGPGQQKMALEFLWAAADAAGRLGYLDKQRELLDQLTDLDVDQHAEPEAAGRVFLLHARYAFGVGEYPRTRAMLQRAIACFEHAGAGELLCEAVRGMARVHTHEGNFPEARRFARRAMELASNEFLMARAEHAFGLLDMLEGKIESSLRRGDRCLILLRKSERFETLAVRALVHSLRARVYRAAGRPRRALVSARHALRLAQRSGDRRLEIEVEARLGVHMMDIDRVEEAESLLRDALLVATEITDRRVESISTLFLGLLLGEQGDPSAGEVLGRCASVSKRIGNTRTEAVCISIQARVLFPTDAEAALAMSEHAIVLLERAGAELIDRIVIRGTRAMILEGLGRPAEARSEVDRLRRVMRVASNRIESPLLHRRQRLATGQLLKAALSPVGPVYRRVHLDRV